MKKVFELMCLNVKLILCVFCLSVFATSCTSTKDMCAAYAYDDVEKKVDDLNVTL